MSFGKNYGNGSVWRKWDLHVHVPGGNLYSGYKATDGSDVLDRFCDEVENSDVAVFGLTDYFAFESVEKFLKRFAEKYPDSQKAFFFNLELRLNEAVNKAGEEVNVHLLFNPAVLGEVPKFLGKLKVTKTGTDEKPITCAELTEKTDLEAATVKREHLIEAFEETFGRKAIRQDHFLVVTAANNTGLRPPGGAHRKAAITDEIDKQSDGFFGSQKNVQYYLREDRYEDDQPSKPCPTFAGSDCHSFEDFENFVGRQVIEKVGKGDDADDAITKDITWVKADTTYEGLKQALYEPDSGERVSIGAVRPDEKEAYKVIRKIKFPGSKDFPEEIVFNDNLCSIIGSRSSGKSALLAYVAHSVDPDAVEKLRQGPGEGEDYHWHKIGDRYEIEWANGHTNKESPGRVVYVPQNYLFTQSEDPEAIKRRIEPVFFKLLPDFERAYKEANAAITNLNREIGDGVDTWFETADEVAEINESLKKLGDRAAVVQEREEVDKRIADHRLKHSLSEDEVKKFMEAAEAVSTLIAQRKAAGGELDLLGGAGEQPFFAGVNIGMVPGVNTLPDGLRRTIDARLGQWRDAILKDLNEMVVKHRNELVTRRDRSAEEAVAIENANKDLIEKYNKNKELDGLVKSSTELANTLTEIDRLQASRKSKGELLGTLEDGIKTGVAMRRAILGELPKRLDGMDQSAMDKIQFGVESALREEDTLAVRTGLNLRDKSNFLEKNEVQFERIRENPAEFLRDLYSGGQKVVAGADPRSVAKQALELTETILFSATMEGDKIGGFSESTMTPGKRSLFALRLILAESEDTWPLLIDQPEDDLDSRSIFDEIVPFLKEKKKERQIIMVSHNANLVIASDSEQLVIANRHGSDRPNQDEKQFNYLTGSLEFTREIDENWPDTLTAQGTCEHACSILDGGKLAFANRRKKYNIR